MKIRSDFVKKAFLVIMKDIYLITIFVRFQETFGKSKCYHKKSGNKAIRHLLPQKHQNFQDCVCSSEQVNFRFERLDYLVICTV